MKSKSNGVPFTIQALGQGLFQKLIALDVAQNEIHSLE